MMEKAYLIFYPSFALVFLTMLVWFAMLFKRAIHMKKNGIKPNDMPNRIVADSLLGSAQTPNNNLMNLFEIPVLFYFLTVIVFLTNTADNIYLYGFSLYVALRYLHSAVHLTYNNVNHRGFFYLGSCSVLWLLWARLIYQVITL